MGSTFGDYFSVEIVKAYNKPMTRQTEERTFMINVKEELLNSKTEWHQPKLIRTTIYIKLLDFADFAVHAANSRIVPFASQV